MQTVASRDTQCKARKAYLETIDLSIGNMAWDDQTVLSSISRCAFDRILSLLGYFSCSTESVSSDLVLYNVFKNASTDGVIVVPSFINKTRKEDLKSREHVRGVFVMKSAVELTARDAKCTPEQLVFDTVTIGYFTQREPVIETGSWALDQLYDLWARRKSGSVLPSDEYKFRLFTRIFSSCERVSSLMDGKYDLPNGTAQKA